MKPDMKADAVAKEREHIEQRMLSPAPIVRTPEFTLLSTMIRDHVVAIAKPDSFFALGSEAGPHLEGISSFFETSGTLAKAEAARRAERDTRRAIEDSTEAAAALRPDRNENSYFFTIVSSTIGRKKTVRVAPGAGQKFNSTDMIVSLKSLKSISHGIPVVLTGLDALHAEDNISVLHDLGDPTALKEQLYTWGTEGGLTYTLSDVILDVMPLGFLDVASDLVTSLVRHSGGDVGEPCGCDRSWSRRCSSQCHALA